MQGGGEEQQQPLKAAVTMHNTTVFIPAEERSASRKAAKPETRPPRQPRSQSFTRQQTPSLSLFAPRRRATPQRGGHGEWHTEKCR